MNRRMVVSGVAHVGLGLSLETLLHQLLSTRRFLGLRCGLEQVRTPREPKVEVTMTPVTDGFEGFRQELRGARGTTWLELYVRQRMLENGVHKLYLAVGEAGQPIFAEWLVRPDDLPTLDRVSPGRYPRLAEDEALIEGAYTFLRYRRMGVMAAAMAQLLEAARRAGARSVLTYVAEDNVPSLRGCARVGFALDHLRVNRHRLGRCSSVPMPPDARSREAWETATAGRPAQPAGR